MPDELPFEPMDASTVLLVVVLVMTSGCWLPEQGGSCTLRGCLTGVVVQWEERLEGPYTARLTFDGVSLDVECANDAEPFRYPLGGATVVASSGMTLQNEDARVTCDSNALMLRDAAPDSLTLELVVADGTAQTFALTPEYRVLECNGPGCGGPLLGEVGAGFELDPCRPAVWGPYVDCVDDDRRRASRVFCRDVAVCGTDGEEYGHVCAFDAFAQVGTCPAAEPERCCG